MSSSNYDLTIRMITEGIDKAKGDLDKLDQSIVKWVQSAEKGAKSSDSLGQTITKQRPNLLQLGTAFGTVTSAGWSLYNAYDSLEKTKMASTRADTKVKTAMLAVQDAQQKLTDAISKYGQGSSEAAEASSELAVKQEQLANAQEVAAIRSEDVTEAFAQFATTLPTMILSVVSAGTAFGTMVQQMGGIHQIVPMVTSSLGAVGGALKMLALNPVGLVLTAIAAVFVLLATNAFGFRDAVNALGKAIGDALPFLQPFLTLIGEGANWFLNLINPVQEASAQLDTLGTSAGGAGTAMEETQVQVEGLGGALIDQGDVVTDVIGFYDSLVAKDAEMAAAYDAFKKAQITGNTEILDSYNLTGEDITKFKEQYEKDMEDAQKAAEKAAEESYNAWKKSRDDINTKIKEGFGVLESHFDKVVSELVSAAEEGMNEFETVMEKHGLSATHPATYAAIIKFMVDSGEAEDDYITFAEFVLANVETLNTTTTTEFGNMMTSWAAEMADSRPEFADEAYNLAAEMTADFDKYLKEGKSPGQAFLLAVQENLGEDEAKKIGQYFPGVILDTTAATFTADTKVPAAVDSLTAKIDAALGTGLSTLPTTTGTEVGKIGPAITAQESKATTASSDMTAAMNSIFQTDLKEIPSVVNTEFGKVPPAITTSSSKAQTATQTMATQINTKVKTIGTQATTTASTVSTEFGTTIPNAAKKMQTDSKPEMDKMVTNTKKFATDMKAELSPIAALFKQVLPDVEQGKSMQYSGKKGYEETPAPVVQNATLSDELLANMDAQEINAITTAINTLKTAITGLQTAFSTLSTSIATYANSMKTNITTFVTTVAQGFNTTLKTAITTTQTAFSTFSTSVSTYATSMQTNILAFATGAIQSLTALNTSVSGSQTTLSTFSTSVSTYSTSMTTNLQKFTSTSASNLTTLNTAVTKSQQTFSTYSTSISTYMSSMTTKINSFASAVASAMQKIVTEMDKAKKSADALKKSIDALKDKTITITTRYVTSGSPSGQHGYQGIVGGPGNVGGVKVGEGFRPELITVTPLTRGTGNHYGATMGGGFGSPGGRGGGEVVNNITVVLDGRVIQRFVEKTALAGIGMQI